MKEALIAGAAVFFIIILVYNDSYKNKQGNRSV